MFVPPSCFQVYLYDCLLPRRRLRPPWTRERLELLLLLLWWTASLSALQLWAVGRQHTTLTVRKFLYPHELQEAPGSEREEKQQQQQQQQKTFKGDFE